MKNTNEIFQEIENRWVKWVKSLNIKIEIPRLISIRETMANIDINLFSYTSINGVCTVVYAIIYQPNIINQDLITSKSRLAEWNITLQRNVLIA